MNAAVTSRQDILEACRQLVRTNGWDAVNIRTVAAACGVAVGSIYNYFGSKAELVSATVESVWCDIFHTPEDPDLFQSAESCVRWLYQRILYGAQTYPGFFSMHSARFFHLEKAEGRVRMEQTWSHMMDGLCTVLERDARVRPDAFDSAFTPRVFAGALFSLLLGDMVRGQNDPAAALELVRRTLY